MISDKYKFALGGLYAASIAIIVFAAFGHLGLGPIDEGHILSASRRLLNGQIPHLDFIWVRPPLSSVLHAPELIIGGDYVLLLSRLVAGLQFAAIAWLGVVLLHEELAPKISLLYFLCCLTLAYTITGAYLSNFFYAWATLDGVLLLIAGTCLLRKDSGLSKMFGFTLIGSACLTKQVFVMAIPLMWLLFGAWRDWRLIVCSLVPGIVYVLFLLFTGSFADAWLQLVSVGDGIIWRGLTRFISLTTLLGFLVGAYATISRNSPKRKMLGVLIVSALLAIMVLLINRQSLALLSFGAAVGVIFTQFYIDKVLLRNLASLVVIGWTSSLSIGTPYPLWVSGIFGVAVLMAAANKKYPVSQDIEIYKDMRKFHAMENIAVMIVLILSVAVFVDQKNTINNSDYPSWRPTVRLDNKFPGASGIYSSPIMASVYDDLGEFVARAKNDGKKFAIVPEFYAWWIAAEQDNQLPIDWASIVELGHNNPILVSRRLESADTLRKDTYFIIQKFDSHKISPVVTKIQTWVKNPDFWWAFHVYKIAGHIHMNFELLDENEHFWLYK